MYWCIWRYLKRWRNIITKSEIQERALNIIHPKKINTICNHVVFILHVIWFYNIYIDTNDHIVLLRPIYSYLTTFYWTISMFPSCPLRPKSHYFAIIWQRYCPTYLFVQCAIMLKLCHLFYFVMFYLRRISLYYIYIVIFDG